MTPELRKRLPLIALTVVAVIGASIGVYLKTRPATAPVIEAQADEDAQLDGAPHTGGLFDSADGPAPTFTKLETLQTPDLKSNLTSEPLFWVDVHDPKATHAALQSNQWLDQALKQPLGQGFLAAWAGFFGTRGKDIGGSFQGTVLSLLAKQVLDKPYRVVWFSGAGAQGAPALVLTSPSARAVAAFDGLVKVAGSGGFTYSCGIGGELQINRLILADKSLYGVKLDDRVVFAPAPQTVAVAMCATFTESKPAEGVAVSLVFSLQSGGRGTQSLGDLLGLDQTIGLDFAVENNSFVPKRVDATVQRGSLALVEPSEALLKSVPESAGLVLFLAVKLPETLGPKELHDMFIKGPDGTAKPATGPTRQIAVIWNPRASVKNELAVIWERAEDDAALTTAMTKGSGQLAKVQGCPTLAYSTEAYLSTLESTCKGTTPSVLHAAAPMVQGLKKQSSFSLTVNLGHVLSQLALDGYLSEHPGQTAGSTEIEAARRLLEELPSVGFTGAAGNDGNLVSSGFRT